MTLGVPLATQARDLLGRAQMKVEPHTPAARLLAAAAHRFDEPLRVAIAGRVKAGKSTLLNSLVGEVLAPTDASECTRLVTWYRDDSAYRVTLVPANGAARPVAFARHGGALEVDLDGNPIDQIERLDVGWPSASLRKLTLIDTPGIASLSTSASSRTSEFLAPTDRVPDADAVIYLVRHVHPEDVRLLEAFHGDDVADSSPVSAIGVLGRADEIGGGRLDALKAAENVAARYRRDPVMRRLCQTVLPVAGLLAQGGVGLREVDVSCLARIAALPPDVVDALTLSADRFCADRGSIDVPPVVRQDLIERLGLFGVRLSVHLLAEGRVRTASSLSAELVRRSGMPELWEALRTKFTARASVLKARSAIRAVEAALRLPGVEATGLEAELERLLACGHELAELRLLDSLRRGEIHLQDGELSAAERLLGIDGPDPARRLAVDHDASPGALRAAAMGAAARWQDRAEHPLSARPVVDAARTLIRTCEGVIAACPAD